MKKVIGISCLISGVVLILTGYSLYDSDSCGITDIYKKGYVNIKISDTIPIPKPFLFRIAPISKSKTMRVKNSIRSFIIVDSTLGQVAVKTNDKWEIKNCEAALEVMIKSYSGQIKEQSKYINELQNKIKQYEENRLNNSYRFARN